MLATLQLILIAYSVIIGIHHRHMSLDNYRAVSVDCVITGFAIDTTLRFQLI